MTVALWVGAGAAGAIHVLIFAMESLWFRRPAVQRRFGVQGTLPETTRLFAFNQGFYNLFLALGTFAGLALLAAGRPRVAYILIGWNCVSMVGAAVILLGSARRLWRGALLQGLPPLVALGALWLTWRA